MSRSKPSFLIEKKFWLNNRLVIGVDEVGRGPLAGPVTVGAVCFGSPDTDFVKGEIELSGIDDSKKIPAEKRVKLSQFIKKVAHSYSICSGTVEEINEYGIAAVIKKLINDSVNKILAASRLTCNFAVIIDGNYKLKLDNIAEKHIKCIIGGDTKSFSIAAASVIAKVERDVYMHSLSQRFSAYGWEKNKGYGTKEHLLAIKNQGITAHHRKLFVRNILNKSYTI